MVMSQLRLVVISVFLVLISGCVLMTDAATRLASDLKEGAKLLLQSEKLELEIEHRPLSFPSGISGDYYVFLQAVDENNPVSGTLSIGSIKGNRSGTTSHLYYMTVPKDLRIKKESDEATYLLLRKTGLANQLKLRGEKAVEIISVR
jgi:hypothetical protein